MPGKPYDSLSEIQRDLAAGSITCRQLVQHYLQRIDDHKHLNAFVAVYADEARQRADEVDAKVKEGKAGRLAGMVLGIKDVLCYNQHGVQAGSRILDGFVSQFTATAVQRVIDEDVIIIGRQNCDEFAMGSSNENSAFGPARNADDTDRVPGGSSGGSAVAVQAGLCLASLGSDTGGSVRQPAAFCGTVGLKPTYARVSRWGLIAYASSFDCIGPITRSVEDAALLLEIMGGADEFDSTVSRNSVPAYTKQLTLNRPLRIGYLRDGVESEGVDPVIRQKTREALDRLREQGHTVEPVDFPLLKHILPTYYILTTAEASSNLSRFDGVRFGYRSPAATDLESLYKKSRTDGFGDEVRRRIILGTFALSSSYYDAYYTKAQQVRRLIKNETDAFFTQYDLMASPVTPTTAFRIGEKSSDPLQMYLADIFTVQANVVGCPAISVPNGTDENGLSIGFQLMAAPFQEADLLAAANELTQTLVEKA
ncbi:Asp-tRNA(Asn)/Glu-tRNA(Gln) amidotransferase subunit GatA [Larkinella terrae]|uniref:Glutamyl-tRNA(Gln) amidotransferase subunit A n=1 Tax=Larkinella terrae TaxID=2025311 RepID=A0A7K0ELE4_9BACT|nr:Asp-tRNA(Asn)/Glu-tRNA(Gln) amidotransferase subunit GatA [Larkinella terrae]MRS62361.1 Asp-tRNA(Asn)/Glu-tRNA(Gln) amidotransferase subunit GatA [Larkinella terrae]